MGVSYQSEIFGPVEDQGLDAVCGSHVWMLLWTFDNIITIRRCFILLLESDEVYSQPLLVLVIILVVNM
jgi:hypothetical protein